MDDAIGGERLARTRAPRGGPAQLALFEPLDRLTLRAQGSHEETSQDPGRLRHLSPFPFDRTQNPRGGIPHPGGWAAAALFTPQREILRGWCDPLL